MAEQICPACGCTVVEGEGYSKGGTLTLHYVTAVVVQKVNLIVGTNNNAAISMSTKKAARGLVEGGKESSQGLLNKFGVGLRANAAGGQDLRQPAESGSNIWERLTSRKVLDYHVIRPF